MASPDNQDGVAGGLVQQNLEPLPPQPREMPIGSVQDGGLHWQGTVLDINDPVESALAELIHVYRSRRPFMTVDGDVFSTFTASARSLDLYQFGTPEAILFLLQREQANINGMRRTGTLFDPRNEEALGSYLELAFYANLLYAWIRRYMNEYRQ